jgi:hypothetical protein
MVERVSASVADVWQLLGRLRLTSYLAQDVKGARDSGGAFVVFEHALNQDVQFVG